MSRSFGRHHVRITPRQRRADRPEEAGASLIIALVVMVAMGVLVAAVINYSATNVATVRGYRAVRTERYAGDAAMKSAINWVATKYNVGRDPQLGLGDKDCITLQDVVIKGQTKKVKVSCKAGNFSNSGKPAEVGQATTEGLVLLSNRLSEPGPYVPRPCEGWGDSIGDFFTGTIFNNGKYPTDASRGLIPETGSWFRTTTGLGTLNFSCGANNRTSGNFKVQGDLVARSNNRVEYGSLSSIGGSIYAGVPGQCINVTCNALQNRNGLAAPFTYLNGTSKASDPGRVSPSLTPNNEPINDIATPYLPVGFNRDGSPIGTFPQPCLTGAASAGCTTAFLWNSTTNNFGSATGDCVGTSPTIVFLPGWYRSASVLNQYTKSSNCKNVTMWFAPDPGPDGKLLTADDKTGAYYFDFRQGSASTCQDGANSSTRWCVGGSTDANIRIVTGTPLGWSPQGAYTPASPGAPDPRAKINVSIDTATTIDKDLSQSWYSTSGNGVALDAAKIDGVAARYHANICIIFCFSSDRAIRARDFVAKVSGPPIDEAAVTGDATSAPKGRVYVTVVYGVTNPTSSGVKPAEAVIEAVSPTSGRHSCGTYTLYGNSAAPAPYNSQGNANFASGLHTYTFTPVQARQLAAACGTTELINGLEVKIQVRGNNFNNPTTDWYLDGVKISYDSFPSANFPNPNNPSGSTSNDVAAKKDCDDTKPGTELIFGGASHVFIADGSLEVCAGPYPVASGDSVDNHINIGIYQQAAEGEITPTGANPTGSNDTSSLGTTGGGTTGAAAQLIDNNRVIINYPGGCPSLPWTGTKSCDRDGTITVPMNGYTPPSGYRIKSISARVGYNPKNSGVFGIFPGDNPRLETVGGTNCNATQDYPKHADQNQQITTGELIRMYDTDSSGTVLKNCLGVTANGASLPGNSIKWHARAAAICVVYICSGASHDEFDGIAYQITLAPTDDTKPRLLPAGGCILQHPNYDTGFDAPDCALVKAVTLDPSDNYSFPWSTKEGQWRGRLSVLGAIYAPSAPIEFDDTDVAYPLASRGAVLRHLRVAGYANRVNYNGTPIGGIVDRTPNIRDVTFTACIQISTSVTQPCGGSDRIITRSRVLFTIDSSWPVAQERARIPSVQWWSSDV